MPAWLLGLALFAPVITPFIGAYLIPRFLNRKGFMAGLGIFLMIVGAWIIFVVGASTTFQWDTPEMVDTSVSLRTVSIVLSLLAGGGAMVYMSPPKRPMVSLNSPHGHVDAHSTD